MQLSLYINEKHVDSIRIPKCNIHITQFIEDLRKKHADQLKECNDYRFVLEGLPSRINNFRSLMG